MKVLLLKDVPKLGKKYDVKEVSNGHALNFLIPNKLAQIATDGAVKKIAAEKAASAAGKKQAEDRLIASIKAIKGDSVTIHAKANEKGLLFSSIHKKEIADELAAQGVDAAALGVEAIKLEKPIKQAGDHPVEIVVGETKLKVKVIIK